MNPRIHARLAALLLAASTTAHAQVAGTPQHDALARLEAASTAPVEYTIAFGIPATVSCKVRAPGATGRQIATNFLEDHAAFYGFDHRDHALVPIRTDHAATEGQVVRFAQTYRGLPVFGAALNVHLHRPPGGLTEVIGTTGALFQPYDVAVPEQPLKPIDLVPALTGSTAEQLARNALGTSAAAIGETPLMIHDPAVFGVAGDPRLVYRVTLATSGQHVSLIDANDGTVVLEYPTVAEFGMLLWDANIDPWCPNAAFIIGNNIGVLSNDPDAGLVWTGVQDVDQFFWDLGRDGYDDDGAALNAYINVGFSPQNAKANKSCGIGFSNGWGSVDVTGHEFAHLVTQETSELEYVYQSGALSESFSDFVGVAIDKDDWLIAEDRPNGNGAIRDFRTPPNFNCAGQACPDHMSKFVVLPPWEDNGGVHSNSQIVNKALYLLVEGGVFGQSPVDPMGWTKAERLVYRTFISLGENATFWNARQAMTFQALILAANGSYGFTAADVCSVQQAFHAVGLGPGDANCDGVPDNTAYIDADADGIPEDGDFSGSATDAPCTGGYTAGCDDNCPTLPNPGQEDKDGDGQGDGCDPDLDGDGIPNGSDLCPNWPGSCLDSDGDGTPDGVDTDDDDDGVPDDNGIYGYQPCVGPNVTNCDDNCKLTPNPGQQDANADGYGDACDADVDGDGVWASDDNCPFVANANQADADADGLGDACDPCPNAADQVEAWTSGIPELGIDPEPIVADSDGDGIPDACDGAWWATMAVQSDGLPYHVGRSFQPDGGSRTIRVVGPAGQAGVKLPLDWDPCGPGGGGEIPWDETVAVAIDGLGDGLVAWLEDDRGRLVRPLHPDDAVPGRSGFRVRPRCDVGYHLVLETTAQFPGDVTFAAAANGMRSTTANPYAPVFTDMYDPPQLADEDADGLIDSIDRCPTIPDPTNADADADSVGDVCDVCPQLANPDQLPVPLPTVTSPDGVRFVWGETTDVVWVRGKLADVATLSPADDGTTLSNGLDFETPETSSWYLFRRDVCGTWGSAARDAALP